MIHEMILIIAHPTGQKRSFQANISFFLGTEYDRLFSVQKKMLYHVTVALTTQTFAGQRKLSGIFRFLSGKYRWDMTLLRSTDELSEDYLARTAGQTDGYLISVHESPAIRKMLVSTGKPIVFIDDIDLKTISANPKASFLKVDQCAIGRTAARHLLSSGKFKTFAFVPALGNPHWSRDRYKGFSETLSARGECVSLYSSNSSQTDAAKLSAWIHDLPKPAAIFAAYDDKAVEVIEACRQVNVKIPKDAMILGAGDDELICTGFRPTLSSVKIPFEEHGYIAARELQAKMMMPIDRRLSIYASNTFEVSRRQTTKGQSNIPTLVQDGLAFIQAYALTGIKVPDVIRHLKVSRRLADLRFHEAIGQSILQTIVETQMKEARRLLRSTSLRISEIAFKCGYSNANYFKNVFSRTVGQSPRAWRKAST